MSLNDFQLLSRLGEGAYSSVYKVKRISDGEEYALKKVRMMNLSEKEKENALNEVRILASIKNKNIIAYKEAFIDEGSRSLCIVMEFADNGDLFQKICDHQKKGTTFTENEIWSIFIQVVRGLRSLHELKIMHRDLKSANVFLYKDSTAKLADMNVSKVAKKGLSYTQTGTPYYASPEVWRDQPYDVKSDIWSLGCVLYEMITLRPPFRAEDMASLYKKVLKGIIGDPNPFNVRIGVYPRIPTHFSQDLASLVKSLLQVSPHLRPTCEKILKVSAVAKRVEKIFGSEYNTDSGSILLSTIRIPRNLLYLTDRLPKPNYETFETRRNTSDGSAYKLPALKGVTKHSPPKIPKSKYPLAARIKNIDGEVTDAQLQPLNGQNKMIYKYKPKIIQKNKEQIKKIGSISRVHQIISPQKSNHFVENQDHKDTEDSSPIPPQNPQEIQPAPPESKEGVPARARNQSLKKPKKKYSAKKRGSEKNSAANVSIDELKEDALLAANLNGNPKPLGPKASLNLNENGSEKYLQKIHNNLNINSSINAPHHYLMKNGPGSVGGSYPYHEPHNFVTNDAYINQLINKKNPIMMAKGHQYSNLQRITNIYSNSPNVPKKKKDLKLPDLSLKKELGDLGPLKLPKIGGSKIVSPYGVSPYLQGKYVKKNNYEKSPYGGKGGYNSPLKNYLYGDPKNVMESIKKNSTKKKNSGLANSGITSQLDGNDESADLNPGNINVTPLQQKLKKKMKKVNLGVVNYNELGNVIDSRQLIIKNNPSSKRNIEDEGINIYPRKDQNHKASASSLLNLQNKKKGSKILGMPIEARNLDE